MFRKGQLDHFEIKLAELSNVHEMRVRIEPRLGRHMRHPQWVLSSVTVQEKPSDRVEQDASYAEFTFDCQNAIFNAENKSRSFTKHDERPVGRYSSTPGRYGFPFAFGGSPSPLPRQSSSKISHHAADSMDAW